MCVIPILNESKVRDHLFVWDLRVATNRGDEAIEIILTDEHNDYYSIISIVKYLLAMEFYEKLNCYVSSVMYFIF